MWFVFILICLIQEKQNQNKKSMKNSTQIYFYLFLCNPANFVTMHFRKHML